MALQELETPWPLLRRTARTVVVVDIVESVRLMALEQDDTIRRWLAFTKAVQTQLLPPHGGRLVKSLGDGMLLEFEAVVPAIQCALAMQSLIAVSNTGRSAERSMCLRIGAHVADVVVEHNDIYGAGVNLAARITSLAGPGEIVVSSQVRDQLVQGLDADLEDLGHCYVKLMPEPVRAFRVGAAHAPDAPAQPLMLDPLRPRVAVIPFDTRDATGLASMLGEAVADELIAALSRNPELTVISRLSTTVLRGRADALASAGQLLKADYALGGAMHVDGDRLRAVLELTEVATQRVVWARSVTGSARGVFNGDDPLVDDVVQLLCTGLARRQVERVRAAPLATLESYCLLMAAVTLLHGNHEGDFERARQMLEHLVERDRRNPAPHAWLAKWHVMRVQQGWTDDLQRESQFGRDCARRALDLDPRSSLSLAIDAFVHCNLMKDLEGAADRCERALAENPSESLAWLFRGTVHAFAGEGEAALGAARQALALSPLDPLRYFYESLTATAALSAGQWALAAEHARRSLKLNRQHTSTWRALTIAQVQLGELDEARRTAASLLQLQPRLNIADYLARSPSSGFDTGRVWSQSLAAAGVPLT